MEAMGARGEATESATIDNVDANVIEDAKEFQLAARPRTKGSHRPTRLMMAVCPPPLQRVPWPH